AIVDRRRVPGAEPAVGVESLCGGVGKVEILVEHRRGPNLQAPNGFTVVRYGCAVVVNQPGPHARQRQADPTGATLARRQRPQRAKGFGAAVPLPRLVALEFGETVQEGYPQGVV